nr:proline-rich protein 36-like [Aegilops tauschii subsp. strangulata]
MPATAAAIAVAAIRRLPPPIRPAPPSPVNPNRPLAPSPSSPSLSPRAAPHPIATVVAPSSRPAWPSVTPRRLSVSRGSGRLALALLRRGTEPGSSSNDARTESSPSSSSSTFGRYNAVVDPLAFGPLRLQRARQAPRCEALPRFPLFFTLIHSFAAVPVLVCGCHGRSLCIAPPAPLGAALLPLLLLLAEAATSTAALDRSLLARFRAPCCAARPATFASAAAATAAPCAAVSAMAPLPRVGRPGSVRRPRPSSVRRARPRPPCLLPCPAHSLAVALAKSSRGWQEPPPSRASP